MINFDCIIVSGTFESWTREMLVVFIIQAEGTILKHFHASDIKRVAAVRNSEIFGNAAHKAWLVPAA